MLPCSRDCAKTRFTDNSTILQLVHRLDWKVFAADVTVVHLAIVEFVAHGGWLLLRIKYKENTTYHCNKKTVFPDGLGSWYPDPRPVAKSALREQHRPSQFRSRHW